MTHLCNSVLFTHTLWTVVYTRSGLWGLVWLVLLCVILLLHVEVTQTCWRCHCSLFQFDLKSTDWFWSMVYSQSIRVWLDRRRIALLSSRTVMRSDSLGATFQDKSQRPFPLVVFQCSIKPRWKPGVLCRGLKLLSSNMKSNSEW